MNGKTCRVFGQDLPAIEYFRPGYVEKGWSGELISEDDVRALAHAHRILRANNMLNPTADKYFFSNALIEGTANFGAWNAHKDAGVEGKLKQLGRWGLDAPAGASGSSAFGSLQNAYIYGICLNYKTGEYADRVCGRSAGEFQRLVIFNGTGTVRTSRGTVSSGENHATKVMRMQQCLGQPQNAPLVTFYMASGGPNPLTGKVEDPIES